LPLDVESSFLLSLLNRVENATQENSFQSLSHGTTYRLNLDPSSIEER